MASDKTPGLSGMAIWVPMRFTQTKHYFIQWRMRKKRLFLGKNHHFQQINPRHWPLPNPPRNPALPDWHIRITRKCSHKPHHQNIRFSTPMTRGSFGPLFPGLLLNGWHLSHNISLAHRINPPREKPNRFPTKPRHHRSTKNRQKKFKIFAGSKPGQHPPPLSPRLTNRPERQLKHNTDTRHRF